MQDHDRKLLNRLGVCLLIFIGANMGIVTYFEGCSTQPPPAPPPIVQAAPPPKPQIPPDPYADLPASVVAAIKSHSTAIVHDGVAIYYPYQPNSQWTVNLAPLRATQIRLAPDEVTDKDNIVVGDIGRWGVRLGYGAIMITPLGTTKTLVAVPTSQVIAMPDPDMRTNMIITTSKRSYILNLQLKPKAQPIVAWYYSDEVRAAAAARDKMIKEQAQ